MYNIVKYCGDFGFIKPWYSVADVETASSKFVTPSIIKGIERNLFSNNQNRILRHRLDFNSIAWQQEVTQSIQGKMNNKSKMLLFEKSIIARGVMVNPVLYLLFDNIEYASIAKKQSICLCRNEDILFPDTNIISIDNMNDFDDEMFSGYESFESDEKDMSAIYCGLNKYSNYSKQYIVSKTFGIPSNLR